MFTACITRCIRSCCNRLAQRLLQGTELSIFRFTVLNFGQHGHVDERDVDFCWDLKPDIVVAHDGFNDAVYGPLCDPPRARRRDNDLPGTSSWSQILHQTSDIPRTQNSLPYRAVNQPVRVLKSISGSASSLRSFALEWRIVRLGTAAGGIQPQEAFAVGGEHSLNAITNPRTPHPPLST